MYVNMLRITGRILCSRSTERSYFIGGISIRFVRTLRAVESGETHDREGRGEQAMAEVPSLLGWVPLPELDNAGFLLPNLPSSAGKKSSFSSLGEEDLAPEKAACTPG
jgi:hypothetical protein